MIHPYIFVGLPKMHINPNDKDREFIIRDLVAEYFGLVSEDLSKRCNKHSIVIPRQFAMRFIRENTQYCLKDIGEMFGGFDHTTVINSLKQIQNGIDTKEPKIYPHYLVLKTKITNNLIFTNEQDRANISSN